MATRRQPAAAGTVTAVAVPIELLDHEDPAWHRPAVFTRWVRKHVPTDRWRELDYVRDGDWTERFDRSVNRWAVANAITMPGWPLFPDRARLAKLGVKSVTARERALALRVT